MVSRSIKERGDLLKAASKMPSGSAPQLTQMAAQGRLTAIQLRALTRSVDPRLVMIGKMGALLYIDRVVLSESEPDDYEELVRLAHDAAAVYVSDGGPSKALYSAKDLVQDVLSVGVGVATGGGGAAVTIGAIVKRFLRTAATSIGDNLLEDFVDSNFHASTAATPGQLRLISSRLDASAAWAQESGPSPAVQFARRVTPPRLGEFIRHGGLLTAIKRSRDEGLSNMETLTPFVSRTAILIDAAVSKDAPLGFASLGDVIDGCLGAFTSGEKGYQYNTFLGPTDQAQCALTYPGFAVATLAADDRETLKLVEQFVIAAVKAKTLDPVLSSMGAAAFRLGAILYYDLAHQTLNGDDVVRGVASMSYPPLNVSPVGVRTLESIVGLTLSAREFGLGNIGGVVARNPVPDSPSRLQVSRAGEALSALGLTADSLNEGTPEEPHSTREAVLLGLAQLEAALAHAAPMSLRYLGKDAESIARVVVNLAPALDIGPPRPAKSPDVDGDDASTSLSS